MFADHSGMIGKTLQDVLLYENNSFKSHFATLY